MKGLTQRQQPDIYVDRAKSDEVLEQLRGFVNENYERARSATQFTEADEIRARGLSVKL